MQDAGALLHFGAALSHVPRCELRMTMELEITRRTRFRDRQQSDL